MKKILIIVLALTLVFALVSCGECDEHIDENGDNICDECGEKIESQPPVVNPPEDDPVEDDPVEEDPDFELELPEVKF